MSYHLFLIGYEPGLARRLFHLYPMPTRVTVISKHHEFIAMNAATAMRLCFFFLSIFLRWALPSTKWSSLEFGGLGVLPQIDPRHIESNRTPNVELAIRPCDRISLRSLKHCQLSYVRHAKHAQREHFSRDVYRFNVDKAFTWIESIVTTQEAGLQHQIVWSHFRVD